MADPVVTDDIAGYGAYLKAQGVPSSDIQGYTKYVSDQHGVDHPSEDNPSWLDTKLPFGTSPRGIIQGGLNALPTIGMAAGGVLGGVAGSALGPVGTVAGAPAGAGLGDMAGTSLKNAGEELLGYDKSRSDIYGDQARALPEGAAAEMGGQIVGKGLSLAANSGPGQAVIGAAKSIPQWAAGKIGRIFADVPEETTARYLANPEAINSAPTREALNDQIVQMKNNADDKLAQTQEDLANAKTDSKNNVQNAQANLTQKAQAYKEALRSQSLTSMAGDTNDAVSALKAKVIQGSTDSYKLLDNPELAPGATGNVQTAPLVKILQSHVDSNLVNGVAPTPSAEQGVKEIAAMQQRLSNMGNNISMPQAKQILQSLDKNISYQKSAGSFAPETDQAFSALRHSIDQDVKTQVPAYAAKMDQVSSQARLLNTTDKLYGTPQSAISNLNRIDSETGQAIHVPLLEALGKETGKDLSTPVNKYLATQKTLSTPSLFQKAVDEFPESHQLASAQSNAVNSVNNAQSAADAAKEKSNLFRGVSAQSVTSKTKALNGANSYGAEATFAPIDEAHGTNLQRDIQARNDADQFAKDDTRGSRKTVLGTALGLGMGAVMGGTEGALVGEGVGALAGHAADKYSGPMLKYGLDKGMALGRGVQNAGEALGKVPSITGQGVSSMVPSQSVPLSPAASTDPKGPDKWAADGFQNLKSHTGDDDRKVLEDNKGAMMVDPKMKNLLVTASSFPPGSKPLDDIVKHLKNRLGAK
jgi:hypothetical protein